MNEGWKTVTHRIEAALSEATSPSFTSDWPMAAVFTHQRGQCLGVFAKVCELYGHQIDDALKRVGRNLFENLQKLAKPYLDEDRHQWTLVDGSNETSPIPGSISSHAGTLFMHLSCELLATSKSLFPVLFTALWQPVLRKFSHLLYQKVGFSCNDVKHHFTVIFTSLFYVLFS